MAVFTHVAATEVEPWLTRLQLGRLLSLTGIEGGIENTNYFLDTSVGRFVLTLFERLSFEQAPFYLELMRHLAQKGLPVPAPRALLEPVQPVPVQQAQHSNTPKQPSSTLLFVLHGKPACVVSRLPGAPQLAPQPPQCAQLGAVLARMHLAVADFPLHQPNLRGLAWWRETAPLVLPHLDASQRSLLEQALAEQQQFAQSASYAQLPRGAVHADLFRDNAMFEGETLCGVFDFYFAGVDHFTFDLAVALNDWCAARHSTAATANAQHASGLDPARARALLRGYQQVRPLAEAERATLPLMLRAAALRFWLSRLWDWHLPRQAHMLKAHDPAPMEHMLRHHVAFPDQVHTLLYD